MRRISLLALTTCLGCAHATAMPREIIDARDAFSRATAGPGPELAPSQIHMARSALDLAESFMRTEGDTPRARDLAYIAERRAQLAESIAGGALARAERDRAQLLLAQLLAKRSQSSLGLTRSSLALAQLQTEAELNELSSLRGAVEHDERGLIIRLDNAALFRHDSARLVPEALTQLDEIARALRGRVDSVIRIASHGSAAAGTSPQALPTRRANTVAVYLEKHGVPHHRLRAHMATVAAADGVSAAQDGNDRLDIIVQPVAAAAR